MTLFEYIKSNDITKKMSMKDFFQVSLGQEGLDRPYTRKERMLQYIEVEQICELESLRKIHAGAHENKKRTAPITPLAAARLDKIIDRDERYWNNF